MGSPLASHTGGDERGWGHVSTRFHEALRRMVDQPGRVANSPSVGRKIVGAGGAAAASVIAKRLAGNLLREGRARASREHA